MGLPMPAFDTHRYVKRLQAAGYSADLAEVHADALMELSTNRDQMLATREDLTRETQLLRDDLNRETQLLRAEMAQLDKELRAEMAQLRKELRAEMAQLRKELRAEMAQLARELRGEMAQLAKDLRGEMAQLAQELRSDFSLQFVKLNASLEHMRWMMRVIAAGMVSLLFGMVSLIFKTFWMAG